MRILHTSHGGLPDSRIEKTALTMKEEGHELLFLGGREATSQAHNAFSGTYHVPIVSHIRIIYDSRFKNRWLKEIERINPDVVHAHNLIAAAMMLESDYPVIYDDHEYWSKQDFRFDTRSFVRRVASKPLVRITPKWERRILESYPVLTVSENIAKEHRRIAAHVEVTNNFPLLSEVDGMNDRSTRKGAVYIGSDFNNTRFSLHRDMTGIRDFVDFDILTGIPHREMMESLTNYRVGLTPWHQHPFHKYCDPNKNYEYLHGGLQVLLTETLLNQLEGNPYVHTFTSYSEIPDVLDSMPVVSGQEIMEHARNHYIWEHNRSKIAKIYKYAKSTRS